MELSTSKSNLRRHKLCTVIPQLSKFGISVEHALIEKHCIDLSKIYTEFCVKGEEIIMLLPLKRRTELASHTKLMDINLVLGAGCNTSSVLSCLGL